MIRRDTRWPVNSCEMPTPAPRNEAQIYRHLRDTLVRAHCADSRPVHRCAGLITIARDHITFQCSRCGDARKTVTDEGLAE